MDDFVQALPKAGNQAQWKESIKQQSQIEHHLMVCQCSFVGKLKTLCVDMVEGSALTLRKIKVLLLK